MTLTLKPVKGAVLKQNLDPDATAILLDKPTALGWWEYAENKHLRISLASPIAGRYVYFIFAEHCTIVENGVQVHPIKTVAAPQSILLNVKWDSQINSRYPEQAHRMCFSSSIHMAMSFISSKFKSQFPADDDYLAHVLKYGDTTDSMAHLRALTKAGYKAQFKQNGTLQDIFKSLLAGLPCCIGVLHHGSLKYPSGGGHWLTIGGVTTDRKVFTAFDPYGSLAENPPYSGAVSAGNGAKYPDWLLNARWTVDSENDGWMMTFYGN